MQQLLTAEEPCISECASRTEPKRQIK